MKSILSLVAVCAVVSLAGCNSTKSNSVAPGAVGENGCCAEKACCTEKGASMGAVSEKSGCCKSEAKACPVTGEVAPGAVSDSKEGCCKSKAAAETVSPGAVSEKSGCSASKANCATKSTCTKSIDG